MYCANCGSLLDNDALFCPNCGQRVAVSPPIQPAQNAWATQQPVQQPVYTPYTAQGNAGAQAQTPPAKPRKKTNKKRVILAVVAVALVAAIVCGVIFLLPKNPPSSKNVFASAANSAPKDSSNQQVLSVCAAAYDTLFDSDGFRMAIHLDDEELLNLGVRFGDELLSTDVYGSVCEGDAAFALVNGKFAALSYDVAAKTDADAVRNSLDGVAQYICQRVFGSQGTDKIDYSTKSGSQILALSVYSALNDHRQEVIGDVLKAVKNGRLNLDALDHLFGYVARNAETGFLLQNNAVPSIPGVLEIAADFLAKMPENVVQIQSYPSGESTRYSFSLNLLDAAQALLDYAKTDATISSLLGAVYSRMDGYAVQQLYADLQSEIDDQRENYSSDFYVSGSIVVKGKYLDTFNVRLPYSDVLYIQFADVNSTTIPQSAYDQLAANLDGDVYVFQTAEDVIRLIEGEYENDYDYDYSYDDDDSYYDYD